MVQRDYILRLIEQAGTILKSLLRRVLAQGATRNEMTSDLRRAAQLGGLDLDLLRVSDVPSLRYVVALTGEPDPGRTWLAAEMLYVDGLSADREGDVGAAVMSYAKARSLFGMIEPTWVLPTGFPEASLRIEEIDARLAALEKADYPPGPGE